MSGFFRIVILILGILCSFTIIRLLLKKRIGEGTSLLWLLASLLILLVSIAPGILDKLSSLVGVAYPPSLLFLSTSLILILICFIQTVQISALNAQVRELTQNFSILEARENGKIDAKPEDNIETDEYVKK